MGKVFNLSEHLLALTGQNKIGGEVELESNLILPKTTNKGVKLDGLAPAFGYRDITADIATRGLGSDPAWSQIDATGFYGYKFTVGKIAFLTFHVPHDYVPGTDVYLHVHYLSNFATSDTNTVKWEFKTAYAQGYDRAAFNFATPNTTTAEVAPTQQYGHLIAENGAITLTNLEVDSLITVVVERITNGGTDNADDIFVLTSDVHYMSTNMATKDKNYPFYS